MRIFIKTLVAIFFGAMGCFMGVYLLNDHVFWKFGLWILTCGALGNVIYKIMRMIDGKYPHKM